MDLGRYDSYLDDESGRVLRYPFLRVVVNIGDTETSDIAIRPDEPSE
jgi:hypothetical protein